MTQDDKGGAGGAPAETCPLVLITWEDSRQPRGAWVYISDLEQPRPVRCVTVGWLLKNEPDAKVVAQSMGDVENDDDMQAGGVMVIPARCILSIDLLEEVGPLTSSCPASE